MAKLGIVCLNIRAGLGRDFRRRPARAVIVICGFDADVVVAQEVDFCRCQIASRGERLVRAGSIQVVGFRSFSSDDL